MAGGRAGLTPIDLGHNGSMADEKPPDVPAASLDSDTSDPRAKWRTLPDRIPPEEWVTEKADPAVPGSVQAAEGDRQQREAWNEIRWGIA